MGPLVGITLDVRKDDEHPDGALRSGVFTCRSVESAGGVPVLMAPQPKLAGHYAQLCDAVVFTGGHDPDTAPFGEPMHPKARMIDPVRQAFELALLDALAKRPDVPVLGICLGMQMMALHAGGKLNQYMPDTHDDPAAHQDGASHTVTVTKDDSVIKPSDDPVYSWHQQAVADPGKMRVVAVTEDETVEAIDGLPMDPDRFYLGVQWHPERGGDGPFNQGLFRLLVEAAVGRLA